MRPRSDRSGSPGTAVLTILFALGERHLHGYGIMKEVEEQTDGAVTLLPSSLYATIKRMLDEGWIEEADVDDPEPAPGRPRRFYRITDAGRLLAAQEAGRMEAMLEMARLNLPGATAARAGESGA